MITMLAEISWAGAFLVVGVMSAFAFMVWAACKYGGYTITTTTEEIDEQPAYKETKVTLDREEIKRILRELQLEKELEKAKFSNDRNPIIQAMRQTVEEMRAERDKMDTDETEKENPPKP